MMKAALWMLPLLLTSCFALSQSADAAEPGAELPYQYPLIKDYGGVLHIPDAAQTPRPGSKVVIDITSGDRTGDVLKGLGRAALVLNLFAQAGVEDSCKVAIVLHGAATSAALSHQAYAAHTPVANDVSRIATNPDLELIRRLRQAGAEVYVCGQAMAKRGYAVKDAAPEVTVAVSAAIVNINLQNAGYAILTFH
ncbi:DsrE family protein [Lignipirellula cremea]|uniref:DsrE/DsrF-like family protein n=1 Tax=Lignipirellula cremea TaxID=2528010 RepID=A0A518DP17_9BACT|nr:DsrE family protein [Lignipirellula cremea]QDU93581.1 DsrE/DsrF-like family protein [Lignipirellula cremea]